MAIIFDFPDSSPISVDEFTNEARKVNLKNEKEILSIAPLLGGLAKNKDFLVEFITDGLKNMSNFQTDNLYSSQTYILSEVNEFSFLRFAIWAPLSFDEKLDENNFYSYDSAHNHDFSLLTAGVLGSGYTTSIYRNVGAEITGYIGEPIQLSPPEILQLSPGRVMLYEAGSDIHVQHPPESLSVSLNLIVSQEQRNIRQLYFDLRKNEVAGYVGNTTLKRASFLRYASILNDPDCNTLLEEIAATHQCETTRLYAYRALAENGDIEILRSAMARDNSNIVRSSVPTLDRNLSTLNIWG